MKKPAYIYQGQAGTNTMIVIAVFTALTCAGGFIRIPMIPVPFTLQTFFVYLSALLLGAKRGMLSQIMFLLIGLTGIPVFTYGGGPAYLLQPTFGYLAAFPLSCFITGKISEFLQGKNNIMIYLSAGLSGALIILLIGTVYLYINLKFIVHETISVKNILYIGFIIFLPAEIIKVFFAAFTARKIIKSKVLILNP